MEVYIELMREQLNSGESKTIFKNISCIVIIGLTRSGRKLWQEEEETRKDASIVPIHQGKKFFTSELFKVIQDAVSLILLYRTMLSFRATSSSTFIMSDVQSIYIPSSIRDWYPEVKIWTTDRQYSFCRWIPWTRITRILTRSTWMHRVMHNTCIKHGRNIKTRYIGSTSILLWRKDWSSIKHDLNAIIHHETLPAYCIPKVVRMETGEVIYEKVYASPRPPPKIFLKHDWMKELGSDVAQRPDGQVVQQFKSSQLNQPNPNPDHDRTVTPVVCRDAVTRKVQEKHVHLVTARASTLKIKQIMIEPGHPLFAVTQVTRKVTSNQCWTRLTSEHLDCHILLWNKLRTIVFVNWSRRSRITLTDMLFNKIYNKTKPTTRSVRRQRKWFRRWAT